MNVTRVRIVGNGEKEKISITFDDEDEAAKFALACDFVGNRLTLLQLDHPRSAAFRDTASMLFKVIRKQVLEVGQRVFPK